MPSPLTPLRHLLPDRAAARAAGLPGVVFFDSAYQPTSGWSLLASHPVETIRGSDEVAWARLEQELEARKTSGGSGGIPRSGFAAGWIEYSGSLTFGLYEGALAYHHATGEWHLLGAASAVAPLLEALCADDPPPAAVLARPNFQARWSQIDYVRAVEAAQELIAAGEIYQVNLTHPFAAPWQEAWEPFELYQRLRAASPAPYAAYLRLGDRHVLSSSPELFLRIDKRHICTRPIKGTRPRGRTEQEDLALAQELTASHKETAELVMITDLERNDLGTVCDYGTVCVSELLKLEQYRQVFHLVSTVEGRLRSDISPLAAVRACFPGGSITGAPKKRAREVIAALEPGERGLYTGAIGYFGFDGQAQFNIAIRTVVVDPGEAHFHVGAGIVADSQPLAEWEETLHKARGILLAAQGDRAKSEIPTCETGKGKLHCPP